MHEKSECPLPSQFIPCHTLPTQEIKTGTTIAQNKTVWTMNIFACRILCIIEFVFLVWIDNSQEGQRSRDAL